jgi:hypothetical protein
MKKGLVIIFFLTMSLVGFAQQETIVFNNEIEVSNTPKAKKVESKEASASAAAAKANMIKLNHKKSNEIISIKAYRKSLQIKVKTVKLC